jgi:integrase
MKTPGVFGERRGQPWADYDWDNCRSRTFRAAAKAAGLRADPDDGARRVRPRDLRSSFATLLIHEGQPPQYVAEQLGHSAAALLRDYARVWEDFDPSQRVSAEEQIERPQQAARRRSGLRRGTRRAPTRPIGPSQRTPCSAGVPRRLGRVRSRERQSAD